jgi:hypothetical protein
MAIGNWVADILLHAYAEMLEETSKMNEEDHAAKDFDGRADAVIICGGTLRGDSVYPPGKPSAFVAVGGTDELLFIAQVRSPLAIYLRSCPSTTLWSAWRYVQRVIPL